MAINEEKKKKTKQKSQIEKTFEMAQIYNIFAQQTN